jgi:hypothetical protein
MDIIRKLGLAKLVSKIGMKTMLAGAIVLVAILAILAAGFVQANSAARSLEERVAESSQSLVSAIKNSTSSINNEDTDTSKAIAELETVSRAAKEQAVLCDEKVSPIAGFMNAGYNQAQDTCGDFAKASVELAATVDGFIADAKFLAALQAAVVPALKEAAGSSPVKPASLSKAWQQAESRLNKIGNVPEEAKSGLSKLKLAAKDIAKHAKAVETAQNNRDTTGFDTANKAVTSAYVKLNKAGSELHSWLADEQQKLLNAAKLFDQDATS